MRKSPLALLIVVGSLAVIAVMAPSGSGRSITAAACPPGTNNPVYCGNNAQAPGFYCKQAGEKKKHVKGQSGTPYSQCVKALAKITSNPSTAPKTACKKLSKAHVKGQTKTPFAACVKAGANYKKALGA